MTGFFNRKTWALGLLVCLAATVLSAKKKKGDEDETQTLQVPKDLPNAVLGETRRLTFYVTPLSAKGLLSQQIRDALKALDSQAKSDAILKIRAFVAGSGDLRRVRDLVSETFTERRRPLPTVSVIQTGGLPLKGAQVQMEAVAEGRRDRYPGGLAWISAQMATSDDPQAAATPLAEASLARLSRAVQAAGADPNAVLRVTCFLSSLVGIDPLRQKVATAYPHAAFDFVQTQREPPRGLAACEAVAGLTRAGTTRLQFLNPEGLPGEPGQSQIALVASPHVLLTGGQASFGFEERDARLAFDRVQKELQQQSLTPKDVAFAHLYPLSEKIAGQVRQVRASFFAAGQPPAGTLVLFEGLASLDAGFAVDVVAAKD